MKRQKFIHEIFKGILNRSSFFINFNAVATTGGVHTLSGICDFHHVQVGDKVVIDSKTYTVNDFDEDAGALTVSGADAIAVKQFRLNQPFFCHGTPYETQAENSKIESILAKTPMVYLMEPFKTHTDHDPESSIDRRVQCTACFLTEGANSTWMIDDSYKYAITPMRNLMEDFIEQLKNDYQFSTVDMISEPKFFTKFGIRMIEEGAKKYAFAELFAGCSVDLSLDIYHVDECGCPTGLFLQNDNDRFLEVD